jgi:hypothetical protein
MRSTWLFLGALAVGSTGCGLLSDAFKGERELVFTVSAPLQVEAGKRFYLYMDYASQCDQTVFGSRATAQFIENPPSVRVRILQRATRDICPAIVAHTRRSVGLIISKPGTYPLDVSEGSTSYHDALEVVPARTPEAAWTPPPEKH